MTTIPDYNIQINEVEEIRHVKQCSC